MACAFPKMEDSEKCNTLLQYFPCNASEKQRLVKENEKIQKEKLGQNQKTRKSEQKPLSLSKTDGFENFSRSGKLVDRGLTIPKIQSL